MLQFILSKIFNLVYFHFTLYGSGKHGSYGLFQFLTRECAHAHERVIAIVDFSLGRLVGWLVRLLTFGHAQ